MLKEGQALGKVVAVGECGLGERTKLLDGMKGFFKARSRRRDACSHCGPRLNN